MTDEIKPTEAELKAAEQIYDKWNYPATSSNIKRAIIIATHTRVNGQDAATLAKRVEELESQQYEHCEECNGVLTMCGELSQFGDPTMDCEVCQLRSRAETAERELAAAQEELNRRTDSMIVAGCAALACSALACSASVKDAYDKQSADLAAARAEIERNRAIICATQEGRTQWNAAEIHVTNQRLQAENAKLRKQRDGLADCLQQHTKGDRWTPEIEQAVTHAKAMRDVVEAAKATAPGTLTSLGKALADLAAIEGGGK